MLSTHRILFQNPGLHACFGLNLNRGLNKTNIFASKPSLHKSCFTQKLYYPQTQCFTQKPCSCWACARAVCSLQDSSFHGGRRNTPKAVKYCVDGSNPLHSHEIPIGLSVHPPFEPPVSHVVYLGCIPLNKWVIPPGICIYIYIYTNTYIYIYIPTYIWDEIWVICGIKNHGSDPWNAHPSNHSPISAPRIHSPPMSAATEQVFPTWMCTPQQFVAGQAWLPTDQRRLLGAFLSPKSMLKSGKAGNYEVNIFELSSWKHVPNLFWVTIANSLHLNIIIYT